MNLEEKAGLPAAEELMKQNPSIRTMDDAISHVVEQFLQEHGMSNLTIDMKNQFSRVKYFSCSAIGADDEYEPQRVLDPLVWLMGTAGVLETIKERRRDADLSDMEAARRKGGGRIELIRHYIWDSLRPVESISEDEVA